MSDKDPLIEAEAGLVSPGSSGSKNPSSSGGSNSSGSNERHEGKPSLEVLDPFLDTKAVKEQWDMTYDAILGMAKTHPWWTVICTLYVALFLLFILNMI